MRQSLAILTACAALAVAQNATKTIEIFIPGGADTEGYAPVASIVSANGATTAMKLTCPTAMPDYDDTSCGWGKGLDYTVISTTGYQGTMAEEGYTMTYSCEHNTKATEINCEVSVGGPSAAPTLAQAVLRGTDAAMLTATVTANAELLNAATGSPSSTKGIQGYVEMITTGTAAAKTGESPTGTGAPASHTGAAVKFGIEGSALLALAGAAALNAW